MFNYHEDDKPYWFLLAAIVTALLLQILPNLYEFRADG